MTRLRNCAAVALTLGHIMFAAPAAFADEVSDCAALAANPFQPGYELTGIEQGNLDVDAAETACLAAVEAFPDNIEARAWLSRVYYLSDRHDLMFPHVDMAADAGNAMAQQLLGDELVSGRAVQPDFDRSFELLTASAAQNYAPGQYSLGLSYRYGEGTEVDLAQAAHYFGLAAEQGYALAMADLAMLKLSGDGTEQDWPGALNLLRGAAERGDSFAMLELGNLLAEGTVEYDPEEALKWFLAADAAGEITAASRAALAYINPDLPETNPEQAWRLAVKATDAWQAEGYFVLGYMAENGIGVEQDLELAREYYGAGAELGDGASSFALGELTSRMEDN